MAMQGSQGWFWTNASARKSDITHESSVTCNKKIGTSKKLVPCLFSFLTPLSWPVFFMPMSVSLSSSLGTRPCFESISGASADLVACLTSACWPKTLKPTVAKRRYRRTINLVLYGDNGLRNTKYQIDGDHATWSNTELRDLHHMGIKFWNCRRLSAFTGADS